MPFAIKARPGMETHLSWVEGCGQETDPPVTASTQERGSNCPVESGHLLFIKDATSCPLRASCLCLFPKTGDRAWSWTNRTGCNVAKCHRPADSASAGREILTWSLEKRDQGVLVLLGFLFMAKQGMARALFTTQEKPQQQSLLWG